MVRGTRLTEKRYGKWAHRDLLACEGVNRPHRTTLCPAGRCLWLECWKRFEIWFLEALWHRLGQYRLEPEWACEGAAGSDCRAQSALFRTQETAPVVRMPARQFPLEQAVPCQEETSARNRGKESSLIRWHDCMPGLHWRYICARGPGGNPRTGYGKAAAAAKGAQA